MLAAGQQYWLSVVPTDLDYNFDIGWGLASPGYPGIELPVAESYWGTNYGWNPTGLNIANEFSVTGTTSAVPEPATFWIAALTLCALGPANFWEGWQKAGSDSQRNAERKGFRIAYTRIKRRLFENATP